MTGKVKNYYAGGNTARGFYNLFDSNLAYLERIFILKGGPGTGKSSLMKAIGEYWVEEGYDIEQIHCASDNDSIDGVIIPALKVGIVDGTAPHVIEPKAPGAIEDYVNLGEGWDTETLAQKKQIILELSENISCAFHNAYDSFAQALKLHDDWEKYYIKNLDAQKAEQLANRLKNKFFDKIHLNKKAKVVHRFLGAATPKGPVDFIQNLTEDIPKRYFIKGRPGTGKSTLLKNLAKAADERGFDVEVYHCGFDPHSLDMLIFRELGIAIFDSTAPHEYFPSRDGDEIIDTYEAFIEPGTDEMYEEEMTPIINAYKEKMLEGTAFLAEAKRIHDELEAIYSQAMDFAIIEGLTEKIQTEIRRMAAMES